MAKPAYIMCSMMSSVDETSKLVSLFNIVEAFDVDRLPENPEPSQAASGEAGGEAAASSGPVFRVFCVWIKDETDGPDDQFECQIALVAPDGIELARANKSFSFGEPFFYRVTVRKATLPLVIPGLGIYRWEGRLRRAGEVEWSARQSFPFVIREAAQPSPPSAPAPAPTLTQSGEPETPARAEG